MEETIETATRTAARSRRDFSPMEEGMVGEDSGAVTAVHLSVW